MTRSAWLRVTGALASAVLASACGGGAGGGEPPDDPPVIVHVCTGTVPEHATPCPGTDQDLAEDALRVVTGMAGTCSTRPCSYVCEAGYLLDSGTCLTPPPPPEPGRFVAAGDGTVLDTATGHHWLADPGCSATLGGVARPGGVLPFVETKRWIAALADGACGLSDGSAPGDWRMPAESEIYSLVGVAGAADDPFQASPAGAAWSSLEPCITAAMTLDPVTGEIAQHDKEDALRAWPVR